MFPQASYMMRRNALPEVVLAAGVYLLLTSALRARKGGRSALKTKGWRGVNPDQPSVKHENLYYFTTLNLTALVLLFMCTDIMYTPAARSLVLNSKV